MRDSRSDRHSESVELTVDEHEATGILGNESDSVGSYDAGEVQYDWPGTDMCVERGESEVEVDEVMCASWVMGDGGERCRGRVVKSGGSAVDIASSNGEAGEVRGDGGGLEPPGEPLARLYRLAYMVGASERSNGSAVSTGCAGAKCRNWQLPCLVPRLATATATMSTSMPCGTSKQRQAVFLRRALLDTTVPLVRLVLCYSLTVQCECALSFWGVSPPLTCGFKLHSYLLGLRVSLSAFRGLLILRGNSPWVAPPGPRVDQLFFFPSQG